MVKRDSRDRDAKHWVDKLPRAQALKARVAQELVGAGVLVLGASPEPRIALLAALLEPLDLVKRVVDKPDRREAKRRAKALGKDLPVAAAVGRTVRDTTAAIGAATSSSPASGGDGGGGGGDGGS